MGRKAVIRFPSKHLFTVGRGEKERERVRAASQNLSPLSFTQLQVYLHSIYCIWSARIDLIGYNVVFNKIWCCRRERKWGHGVCLRENKKDSPAFFDKCMCLPVRLLAWLSVCVHGLMHVACSHAWGIYMCVSDSNRKEGEKKGVFRGKRRGRDGNAHSLAENTGLI